MRQQHNADNDPADDVAHCDLQKRQVRIVGKAGHADDGERAGFRRDDGQGDRPPRNVAIGQEIIPQRALFFPEAQAEQSDAGQVQRDDGEVEMVESHE